METLNSTHMLLLAGLFAAVFVGVVALLWWLAPRDMQRRIDQPGGVSVSLEPLSPAGAGWVERIADISRPLSQLSIPKEGWEDSPLRLRLMNAGWRTPAAAALYFAAKAVLALMLPLLGLAGLLGPALVANHRPGAWPILALSWRTGYAAPM